jgi:hypothetical protein
MTGLEDGRRRGVIKSAHDLPGNLLDRKLEVS